MAFEATPDVPVSKTNHHVHSPKGVVEIQQEMFWVLMRLKCFFPREFKVLSQDLYVARSNCRLALEACSNIIININQAKTMLYFSGSLHLQASTYDRYLSAP